ncbi:MAG: prephenate dehydrogenase [Alphaproteobacteria bacterium]
MFNEITIIGPGLIGASLALALKEKKISKRIVGIDQSQKNLNDALKIKAIDEDRKLIDIKVQKSEIIFICTPVGCINEIIEELAKYTLPSQILSDVGSVKNIFSKRILELSKQKYLLVPGHPIAGTEHSGAVNAQVDLFKKKWCILTPVNNQKKSLKLIADLWKKIGMRVSLMTMKEHDKIMSITSHLPHLIAFTIVGTAFNLNIKNKNKLINFAAGGFKDFTRIGSSDPRMWTDIFIKNKKHITDTLDLFLNDISKLNILIKKNKTDDLFTLLKRTKLIRKSILKKEI